MKEEIKENMEKKWTQLFLKETLTV
jgi:hypothetical protein